METSAKTVLLSVLASAAAIFLAALTQLGLTTAWPRMQQVTIRNVSLDSYVVVVALLILCFVVGWSLRRRTPNGFALWSCAVVPAGWLVALLVVIPHERFSLNAL